VSDINSVILTGRLTRDPELKYTPSGKARCVFRIASNHSYKDASGTLKEDPAFVRVVCWDGVAESTANHRAKGDGVAVAGRLRTYPITDDDGERMITEINAKEVVFTTTKREA